MKLKLPEIKKPDLGGIKEKLSDVKNPDFGSIKEKFSDVKKPELGGVKEKLSNIKMPKIDFELDESQANKIWIGEIGFGLVAAFASVLIALAS